MKNKKKIMLWAIVAIVLVLSAVFLGKLGRYLEEKRVIKENSLKMAVRPTEEALESEQFWLDNYAYEIYLAGYNEKRSRDHVKEMYVKSVIGTRITLGIIDAKYELGFNNGRHCYLIARDEYRYWRELIFGKAKLDEEAFEQEYEGLDTIEVDMDDRNAEFIAQNFTINEETINSGIAYYIKEIEKINPDEVKIVVASEGEKKADYRDKTYTTTNEYIAYLSWDDYAGFIVKDASYNYTEETDIVIHGEYTPTEPKTTTAEEGAGQSTPEKPSIKEQIEEEIIATAFTETNQTVHITREHYYIWDNVTQRAEQHPLPKSLIVPEEYDDYYNDYLNGRSIGLYSIAQETFFLNGRLGIYACKAAYDAEPVLIRESPNPPISGDSDGGSLGSVSLRTQRFLDKESMLIDALGWEWIAYTEKIDLSGNLIYKFDIFRSYGTHAYPFGDGEVIVEETNFGTDQSAIYTLNYNTGETIRHDWLPFTGIANLTYYVTPLADNPSEVIVNTCQTDPDTAEALTSKLYLVDLENETTEELSVWGEGVGLNIRAATNHKIVFEYKTELGGEKMGELIYR